MKFTIGLVIFYKIKNYASDRISRKKKINPITSLLNTKLKKSKTKLDFMIIHGMILKNMYFTSVKLLIIQMTYNYKTPPPPLPYPSPLTLFPTCLILIYNLTLI